MCGRWSMMVDAVPGKERNGGMTAVGWRLTVLAVTLVLFGAVACGGGSEDDAGPRPQGSTATTGPAVVSVPGGRATSTSPPTTVAAPFEFVTYRVGGGNPRVNDQVKVYPDGRVVYADEAATVNMTVPPARVAELRAALDAADLPSLPPNNGSATPNGRAFQVLYGGQSVRFFEGAMPPSLGRAVTLLDQIVSEAKRRR
jgi:hypothetical protein